VVGLPLAQTVHEFSRINEWKDLHSGIRGLIRGWLTAKPQIPLEPVISLLYYINWSEITSFSSYEIDGRERISIRYKIFSWQKEPASIIMVAPKNKKQMLREILLAKNIPEQT
jgi:hypothetical protein